MGTETSQAQSDVTKDKISGAIERLTRGVFGMPYWQLHVLVLALAMVQNGVWYSSQAVMFWQMSKDITRNPFLGQATSDWVLPSFLGPTLAYFTTANRSLLAYCLLHLVVFLIGFTAILLVIRRRNGDFAARSVLIVFFLSPLSNIVFTWLGSPDVFTVLLGMAVVVFWNSWPVLLVCGVLMGVAHPEQGTIMLVLLSVFSSITRTRGETIRLAAIGLGGLLLGAAALQLYFASHHFELLYSRAEYILVQGWYPYVKATLGQLFTLLFSLYGVLLLFIAVYIAYEWRRDRSAVAFAVYSAMAFVVILFTLDQTRVFAILTYPALLLVVFSPSFQGSEGSKRKLFETVLAISFAAGIVIPRFSVWSGNILASAYPSIIGFLHDPQSLLLP